MQSSRLPWVRSARVTRGVTLIELVMSMGMSSILMAMVFSGFSLLTDQMKVQEQITRAQLDEREMFIDFERDLKNAGADPLTAGLFTTATPRVEIVPVGQALAGGLRLRMDITGSTGQPDGDCSDAGEVTVYALDSATGTLNRWLSNGSGGMVSQPLLTGVTAFTPTLLDSAGASATSSTVTQVRVVLSSKVKPRDPRLSAAVRSEDFTVKLRN